MSQKIIFRRKTALIVFSSLFFIAIFSFVFADKLTVQAGNLTFGSFFGGANASPVANLNMVIGVAQEGIAAVNTAADKINGIFVCPDSSTAGCDYSLNNGIIRTNDSVVYSYDYSVNGGSEDITITATAPLGTVWNVLPAFCNAGSAKNSGDGITTASVITCKRGLQVSGTSESLPFTMTVLGSTKNGTILTATGAVSGAGSTTANASALSLTATAAPRFNLRLVYQNYGAFTLSNVFGYRIEYRATIEVLDDSTPASYNPRYGSAELASPITFTDNVSQISPNAVLQSCAKQNDYNGSAGTINCAQTGAGQNISVTVSNSNTTLSQYATPPSDNKFATGTYQIYIFIPAADVSNAPGSSLNATNVVENFDPNSTNGDSNFGASIEMLTDNTATKAFTPLTGNFGKAFVKDYNSNNTTSYGTGVGGNRFVAPGEIFASQVSLNNNTGAALNNVVLCDVMDNSKYSVIETAPGSGVVYGNDTLAPTAVEYATGYINANWIPTTSAGNPNGIRTECNDPSITWYSSPTAVPGGLAAITKFRVKYNTVAANATGTVRVRVQARENNYYTNQTVSAGAILPNFAIWRSDELNPNYNSNNYYPNVLTNSQTGGAGARLFLARAIARITKETESNNTVNSVATGGTIGYVLKPTLSTTASPTPVQISVMDVLPVGLSYIVGTGLQNGNAFEPQIINCTGTGAPDSHCTAAGQQILTWILNNQTPGVAIQPISFRAAADLTVINNQTVVNTAIVSSPADPSQETYRTATRNVTGASPSTLLIFKNTNTSQIEVGAPFRYTVSYRNASINNDFSNLDFIDVLPFNGDSALNFDAAIHNRTPASAFNGTHALTSLSATTTASNWYFTNAAPATINISAKHASNANPGMAGSIWCAGTSAGPAAGCGFTLAQVTAVRMTDNVLLPRSNAIRSFTLNFSSSGNQANDRYTNNSSGSAAELALAVSSNNVPIVVLESSISGLAWFDTNGDGVRGSDEIGRIAGLTAALNGTSGTGATINRTTTTAANGTYAFTQLPSGTYTVQFSSPANYTSSPADVGGDDTLDSDGNAATLVTQPITLGINNSKTNIDEGFYQLNLAGTVWRDLDNNGLFEAGENGIAGVDVALLDSSCSTVLQTTQTDGAGNYSFTNLAAGDYRVRIQPNGLNNSAVSAANPNNDVDNDNNGINQMGSIVSNVISLNPGTEPTINPASGATINSTLDFGLAAPPTSSGVVLGGRVLTAAGRGIWGARVLLVDENGTAHFATTNPFGYYRFTSVSAGTTVIVSVSAKNQTFAQNTQAFSVREEFMEINFVADR